MPHIPANPVALAVFCGCFLLVTGAGFWAVRWQRSEISSLDEWGLAGRKFGPLVTWFLIGGDLYTAYTVIAVPAALFGAGAVGFFAIPYCIMSYPLMMLVLPPLWRTCRSNGYVTLADYVRGRYDSRWLCVAVAVTGILATMPYIALQLIGMREVIAALGIHGEWPLVAAFVILAAYTYSSGLRAPALIAIVKDVMLYIMVLAAVLIIPPRLGGYAHIFALASANLAQHSPPASVILRPAQFVSYASLAFGSALALMLYPHTITGTLSAGSDRVIRRNAAFMPAYNLLLGLIALLGYMAIAAGVHTANSSSVVPLLLTSMFPAWFAGFCLAAIGIGALVPAAHHVDSHGQSVYPQLVWRAAAPIFLLRSHDGRPGGCHGQDHLPGHQTGRPGFCSPGAIAVRHRTAAAGRYLDSAGVPRGSGRTLHPLLLRPGFTLRLVRRHGCGHGHGRLARAQNFYLSSAYQRSHVWHLCGSARPCPQPASRSHCLHAGKGRSLSG